MRRVKARGAVLRASRAARPTPRFTLDSLHGAAGLFARRRTEGQASRTAVDAIAEHIPLGQPILVGYHSEGRHRRDLARIDAGIRKAIALWDKSEYWQRRARAAIAYAEYKQRPGVRHRRIKRLEAELRAQRRRKRDSEALVATPSPADLSGTVTPCVADLSRAIAHHDRWIGHLECRLAYERAMLAETDGTVAQAFDIEAGGRVLILGEWHIVTRVNKDAAGVIRSVTIDSAFVQTRGIEKVSDYRAPSVDEAAAARAASKLPPLCNYPGPGFHHLTQAQWKHTHLDYKGSRELGVGANRPASYRLDISVAPESCDKGRYRVRTIVHHGALVVVYLTDVKCTEPPSRQWANDHLSVARARHLTRARAVTLRHLLERPAPEYLL